MLSPMETFIKSWSWESFEVTKVRFRTRLLKFKNKIREYRSPRVIKSEGRSPWVYKFMMSLPEFFHKPWSRESFVMYRFRFKTRLECRFKKLLKS